MDIMFDTWYSYVVPGMWYHLPGAVPDVCQRVTSFDNKCAQCEVSIQQRAQCGGNLSNQCTQCWTLSNHCAQRWRNESMCSMLNSLTRVTWSSYSTNMLHVEIVNKPYEGIHYAKCWTWSNPCARCQSTWSANVINVRGTVTIVLSVGRNEWPNALNAWFIW